MTAPNISRVPAQQSDGKPGGLPARIRELVGSRLLCSGLLLGLLLSGLFRLTAFVRETYIAGQFGLSAATDAYYGLQQLPLSVATFMFGAFALAFAPSYSESNGRSGGPEWLAGLFLHGTVVGLALTAVTSGLSPVLLRNYIGHVDATSLATLNILSACYVPIIYLGIWTSMLNARGCALRSMTIAALPYLIMTASLILICEVSGPRLLSLPASMSIGFWLVGGVAAYKIYGSLGAAGSVRGVLWPLRFPEFRSFSKQLLASASENVGFVANQLLMIYFFGLMGTGEVTANNYAMRIGLLASSLITQPVASVAQSRFCTEPPRRLQRTLSVYLGWTVGLGVFVAGIIYVLRKQIVAILFLHGRFTSNDAESVMLLIPAWSVYCVVLSVNTLLGRYLFVIRKGKYYATLMLSAYCFSNLMRALCGEVYPYAPAIIWCGVIGEGAAMVLTLRAGYRSAPNKLDSRIALAVS